MALCETTVGSLASAPPEIQQLAAMLPFELDDLEPDDRVLYAVGSVRLDQLVMSPNSGVLVTGDLSIDGLLDDRPLCADPEDMRYLVVGGDLRAGTILLGSEAHIGGSVIAGDYLIAESDGEFSLHVGGDLVARRIIALGHHVEVAGKTTADFAIGYLGLECDIPKSQMAATFTAALVNQWGGIEIEQVAGRALAGEPVLASD